MDMKILPGHLSGTVDAIASKSHVHRLLICAALSDKETEISVLQSSEDIDATARALSALNAGINYDEGHFSVSPIKPGNNSGSIDCGESGSTLRFLLPVAAAVSDGISFTGSGKLPERPIGELLTAMERRGTSFSSNSLPLKTSGRLTAGEFTLPGNVSSQYISGLLMALPILEGDSHIELTSRLESAAYVDITLSCLESFGISVEKEESGFFVPGFQKYRSPGMISAEGDWSNAAFFLASGALGKPVTVRGLNLTSTQGDKAIVEILQRFGADVVVSESSVTVFPGYLKGCEIDLSEIPDLLPILSVVASFAEGETRFYNAARLRIKESDRLHACAKMLGELGGDARESSDKLIVRGRRLSGGSAQSFGDHRMVMSSAIAALFSSGETIITGAQAVYKSYPGFFRDLRKLGGKALEL